MKGPVVDTDAENIELKAQIAQLREEVAGLRDSSLHGSKAEALFALQYDTLPDRYKSPRAIAIYKKIQTYGIFFILACFLALAVMISGEIRKERSLKAMIAQHRQIEIPPVKM